MPAKTHRFRSWKILLLFAGSIPILLTLSGCDGWPLWPSTDTFSITYNGNGADSGTVPVDHNQYPEGATVTVLGNIGNLVKAANTFSGFNTAADGNGTTYAADATFEIGNTGVILYALWTAEVQNNAPTDILLSSAEVQERVAIGTIIGTLVAVDDAGDTHSFSIAPDVGDADSFTISGNELRTAVEIDYETNSEFAIVIVADDGSQNFEKPFTISVLDYYDFPASDYVNLTPGHGVKYTVVDEHAYGQDSFATDVWVVAQAVPSQVAGRFEYLVSVTQSGTTGDVFKNSLLGGRTEDVGGGDAYAYGTAKNATRAKFYQNFIVPLSMEDGEVVTDSSWGTYTISDGGSVTVGAQTFNNCIRIDIDRPDIDDRKYTNGSGYAILAPEIGIVKIEFTRGAELDPISAAAGDDYTNTTITFTYIEHTTFELNSISGTLTTNGTNPAPDVYVQLADEIFNTSVISDSSGNYTLTNTYGPDLQLYFGYDGNDALGGVMDSDYPDSTYPKEYVVNGISGDVSDLIIDLSSL